MGNPDGGFADWCGGWNDCAVGDAVMKTKFTKGPWVWMNGFDGEDYLSSNGEEVLTSRWEGGSFTSLGVSNADAHLIAAAPDMYEALEDAAMEIKLLARGTTDSYDAIMALLAKARGEQ